MVAFSLSVSFLILSLLPLLHGSQDYTCDSPQYLGLGQTGAIRCLMRKSFYAVYWYNNTNNSDVESPLLTFQNNVKGGDGYLSSEFDVSSKGSLIIKNVSLRDEHVFRVVILYSDNGSSSTTIDIEVIVTVPPNPSYLIVDGCEYGKGCAVGAGFEGSLTCTAKGIRPQIQLEWIVTNKSSPNSIMSFTNQEMIVESNGYTNDISITSDYLILPSVSPQWITVLCQVSEKNYFLFDLKTKMDLLFPAAPIGGRVTTTAPNIDRLTFVLRITLASTVVLGILLCILCIYHERRLGRRIPELELLPCQRKA